MGNVSDEFVLQRQPPIRELVYKHLRESIMNNEIPPSTHLVEGKIAEQIGGTSRTPVREALHILEKEGLLEIVSGKGYTVKSLDWDEFEQLCEIRMVNETLGARWAVDAVTLELLSTMEDNLIRAEEEIRAGNPRSFVQYDAEFHSILIKSSCSERLLELCSTLRQHMLRYRIRGLHKKEVALRALGEHRTIYDCLKRKDKRGVVKAVRNHLKMVRQSMMQQHVLDG